jgi:urease accessory protein
MTSGKAGVGAILSARNEPTRKDAGMASRLIKSSLIWSFAMMPAAAFAHTGVGDTAGFAHGFSHPVSGLDHILAMVMVGVFAWQLGGRALWLVPGAFVAVMAMGGALGVFGVPLPFVEAGIALSVVFLGVAVALDIKAPVAIAMGLVGVFAMFHGHAHGAEMPENAAGIAYAGGFMLATAVLHAAGIGAGFLIGRTTERSAQIAVRSAGALATLAGVGFLTGFL